MRLWWLGRGKDRGRDREFGMDTCTLPYLKWITNKNYCTAQGTLLSFIWQSGWEESLGENGYMYLYG